MHRILLSSFLQQFTFAFIGLWKIQRLYQTRELDFLGQFFIFCSLFLFSQLVFDAARKTILSSISIESSTSWNQFVFIAKRNFLLVLLAEFVFSSFIIIFIGIETNGLFSGLVTICVIVQIQAISGLLFAMYTFKHGFVKANLIQTSCTLSTFPIFYFAAPSSPISVLLLLNFSSNILPGLLTWSKSRPINQLLRNDLLSTTESIYKRFVLIQISENSSNSLNAPIIGARLDADSVAEYSIYSRFAFLYDFVPIALFAFFIKGRDRISVRQKRNIRIILFLNSLGVTIFCILAFEPIVSFLSSGKLSPDIVTILPYLISGAIISYTSFTIQSSVSLALLTVRVQISATLLLLNLSVTWIFVPSLGPSFAYLATGMTTLLYAFFLYLYHRRDRRNVELR